MDGSKSFTICGDPLYFAPEIISNQGYDYGADLWAFGVLSFELMEGVNPFGTSETEETAVFKAITAYKSERLPFTAAKTDPPAQKLIVDILNLNVQSRLGYKASRQVKEAPFFSGKCVYVVYKLLRTMGWDSMALIFLSSHSSIIIIIIIIINRLLME